MSNLQEFRFTKQVYTIPLLFVFSMWVVYGLEYYFSLHFSHYGILPRRFIGLRGILFSPFIHSGITHLFSNSIPLIVLLMCLIYFYRDVYLKILLYGGLLTGFFTWLFAREAYHIGASGIVYLLFSFVFFSGMIKKQFQLIAVSLIVIFLYGGFIWYLLPIQEDISYEGHLSGFLVGLCFAYYFRSEGIVKQPKTFKQTEFDSWFDEDGNFNPPKTEEEEIEID